MTPPLGFREARRLLVAALRSGRFDLDASEARRGRNLLQSGRVTAAFVALLLERATGTSLRPPTPHHVHAATWVYVFLPADRGRRWYIKAFWPANLTEGAPVIVSVHEAVHG